MTAVIAGLGFLVPVPASGASPDVLVPLPPSESPSTDYGWFEQFRLTQYATDTEALIKETFGSQLVFDAEGDWVYPSYYSVGVGFSTNLATLTVVEYGATSAYGSRTTTQDAYYYNHLHYLTDLQPNRTYHYRILAQGQDGQWLASEDRVATTKAMTADVIRIPEDMTSGPRYILTEPNKTYLVTRDMTVNDAFIRIDTSNVVIDLGGHTIVYDNGEPIDGVPRNYSEWGSYGIHAGVWNQHDIEIYNGTLRQGAHGGAGFGGAGYNPISLDMVNYYPGNVIAGITADYYGANVDGFYQVHVWSLEHNVLVDRGIGVKARDIGIHGAIGSIENASYNSFRRFRQMGIVGAKNVLHNELYSDSYATNSYLIWQADDSEVAYNKLFGVGYMPVGMFYGNHSQAHDNFIYMHGTANRLRFEEYGRWSGIAGIRFTMYNPATGDYSITDGPAIEDLAYENNTIIMKAWAECNNARGLWINTGRRSKNTKFLNNTVKVEAVSDQLDWRGYRWDTSISTVDINGGRDTIDPALVPPLTLVEGNRFISNVEFVAFGSYYGTGIQNVLFKNNVFEKLDHHSSHFLPFTVSFWTLGSELNRMIDNVAVGWDFSTAPWIFGWTFSELEIGSTFDLTLTDTAGVPIAGQVVALDQEGDWTTWHQAEWHPVYGEPTEPPDRVNYGVSGMTDAAGKVQVELDEIYHLLRVRQVQERVDYNSVTVTVAGYEPATVELAVLRADGRIVLTGENEGPPAADLSEPYNFAVHTMASDSLRVGWWTGQDVEGTKVYRATSPGGPFELIATVSGDDHFDDTGLPLGVTYYYKAAHFKGNETGAYTATVAKATEPVWRMPYNFAVHTMRADTVWVSWWTGQDVEGTKVYRATSPNGPFQLIATVTGEDSFTDTNVVPGVTYYYKAAHFKGNEAGAYTATVGATSF
jgi:hypothetical protein